MDSRWARYDVGVSTPFFGVISREGRLRVGARPSDKRASTERASALLDQRLLRQRCTVARPDR
jgi:hypothetical protein